MQVTVQNLCMCADERQRPDAAVITRVPCAIRLLRTSTATASFYDFEEYERLVDAARGDEQEYLTCAPDYGTDSNTERA